MAGGHRARLSVRHAHGAHGAPSPLGERLCRSTATVRIREPGPRALHAGEALGCSGIGGYPPGRSHVTPRVESFPSNRGMLTCGWGRSGRVAACGSLPSGTNGSIRSPVQADSLGKVGAGSWTRVSHVPRKRPKLRPCPRLSDRRCKYRVPHVVNHLAGDKCVRPVLGSEMYESSELPVRQRIAG